MKSEYTVVMGAFDIDIWDVRPSNKAQQHAKVVEGGISLNRSSKNEWEVLCRCDAHMGLKNSSRLVIRASSRSITVTLLPAAIAHSHYLYYCVSSPYKECSEL